MFMIHGGKGLTCHKTTYFGSFYIEFWRIYIHALSLKISDVKLCVQLYRHFPGVSGWLGKIKIKDHLSPTESENGTELGNNKAVTL